LVSIRNENPQQKHLPIAGQVCLAERKR
jgi:hypothetical protein